MSRVLKFLRHVRLRKMSIITSQTFPRLNEPLQKLQVKFVISNFGGAGVASQQNS